MLQVELIFNFRYSYLRIFGYLESALPFHTG